MVPKGTDPESKVTEGDAPKGLAGIIPERQSEFEEIDIPELQLPKGGGALKSIDEKFSVNGANGTASLALQLPLTPNRSGFTPKIDLSYSSGAGNGPFGMGWSLGLSAIQRKTDRKLPRYLAEPDEDTFVISGAEDLVPALEETAPGVWGAMDQTTGGYRVRRFRPRVAGDFARIELITHAAHGTYWKVTDRANTVTIYGRSEQARLADPEDPARVFRWLPEFSYDNMGNWILYDYKPEDLTGVPETPAEMQRHTGLALFANTYLVGVRYGNHAPYSPDLTQPYDPPLPADQTHYFDLVLDYGEHDIDRPTPAETVGQDWAYRPDAFSSYRSGFDIRTARLCQRILMFHNFPDEALGADALVRSLDFTYAPVAVTGGGLSVATHLTMIEQAGYVRHDDGSYARKALPPMELSYQPAIWDHTVHVANPEAMVDTPVGTSAPYQFVDLFGEGIAGVLTEAGGAWHYKHNRGDRAEDGQVAFERAHVIPARPNVSGLNGGMISVEDLEASGEKQIVVSGPQLGGFFALDVDDTWQSFSAFSQQTNLDYRDPSVKRIDLTGDGRAGLIVAEDEAFVWYASKGKEGFAAAERACRTLDEDRGPAVVFSEAAQTVFLADMSGDGLTDIVRIRNGEIVYWPNLGYGRFGAKVAMADAPLFDHPDRYAPKNLRLSDITGTGPADLIYLAGDVPRAWINQAGNGWGAAEALENVPPLTATDSVQVADIMGQGTPCLIWSTRQPADASAPLRYVNLMGGRKPHLLIGYANNLGKETTLSYRSSTHFYLRDKAAGTPWVTRLPFPVQVVENSTLHEHITGTKFMSHYTYHHGYWDPVEKEFRGFGRVDRRDTEDYEAWVLMADGTTLDQSRDLFQSPMLTRTWYHNGAWDRQDRILTQYADEYWPHAYDRAFPAAPLGVTEPALPDGRIVAVPSIADPLAIVSLSPEERREALRACKGVVLRQEVFAMDAPGIGATDAELQRQMLPYSVDTHSCHIQLLQPRGPNLYAVFILAEDEAMTIGYERNPADPKIEHAINLELDDLGNVLEKANIHYGRDPAQATAVTDAFSAATTDFADFAEQAQMAAAFADALSQAEAAQERTRVMITRSQFTNDVETTAIWRARAPSEVETFEITGVFPAGDLFGLDEMRGLLSDANSTEIAYEATATGGVQRRRIEHQRTTYYDENAAAPLPLHQLASHGLTHQGQICAFTPALLGTLYDGRIAAPATVLPPGGYVHSGGDANWWMPTGTVRYADAADTIANVRARFFRPHAHIDAFGSETLVTYHKSYFMMLEQTVDAVGNTARIEAFDFRILSPVLLRDANDNLTAIVSDELAMVVAQAHLGKDQDVDNLAELELADTLIGQSADSATDAATIAALLASEDSAVIEAHARALLRQATTRHIYDLNAWRTEGKPGVALTIARERHHADDPAGPLHISYEYTDGSGAVAMVKIQAEPGLAKQVMINSDGNASVIDVDTVAALRWVGTGRTVLNNKGKPVRKYEPYFSVTPAFETLPELVATGVSTELHYDPAGRLVRTDVPDGTFARSEFSPWHVTTYDTGDTVLESRWYTERVGRLIDAELIAQGRDPIHEAQAAVQAEIYANTPNTVCLDTLGRPVLSLNHNGFDDGGQVVFFVTNVILDVEGNVREVIDARGNTPMTYGYDMLGRRLTQTSMDAGSRWVLRSVTGEPIQKWDERGHVAIFTYDALQRPLTQRITGGDGAAPLNNVVMNVLYGEGQPNDRQRGLRGRMHRRWDTGGLQEWTRFDSKGNLLESQRRFASNYRGIADWSGDLDAPLEAETHTAMFAYDAVGRVTRSTAPDGSLTTQLFNEANLLTRIDVTLLGAGAPDTLVTNIDYDAMGQRRAITYGNGTQTIYRHDPLTFRLLGLITLKAGGDLVQDLSYTHDCAGNLTHQHDRAIPAVFFNNQKIEAVSKFNYDPLYRLVGATGREHAGQHAGVGFGVQDNWNDAAAAVQHQPGDTMAWRTYSESYDYDCVGNIGQLIHSAMGGSYTRNYTYEPTTNRLARTQIGAEIYAYDHHPEHGFLRQMPHLPLMRHNFRDELSAISRQAVGAGTPETTYYVYDHDGNRIRKVTEQATPAGGAAARKDERLYLGSMEYYRSHAGGTAGLERRTLSVMDDMTRVAMLDTRNGTDDGTPAQVTRYQLSNHIGSAVMELDATGRTLSYSEYHPYGTVAYEATDSTLTVAAQRYRYTGMESDEESGLSHHKARYYCPWLARWSKPDPAGLEDGINDYQYVAANPVRLTDPSGKGGWDRFLGGVKMVGGALETVAGGAMVVAGVGTGWTGVGIGLAVGGGVVTAHGLDVTVSGFRTMWNGEQVDTGTSHVLQGAGMTRTQANLTDAGISIVGSFGASAVTRAPAAVGAVDDVLGAGDDVVAIALRGSDEAAQLAQSSESGLVHLTTQEGAAAIQTSSTLGRGGTSYVGPTALANASNAEVMARTSLTAAQTTHVVSIPARASGAFQAPLVVGPFTGWQRAAGTLYSTSRGSVNLSTGATASAGAPINQLAFVAIDQTVLVGSRAVSEVLLSTDDGEASENFSSVSLEPETTTTPISTMPAETPLYTPGPEPQQSVMPEEQMSSSEEYYSSDASTSGYCDAEAQVCYAY